MVAGCCAKRIKPESSAPVHIDIRSSRYIASLQSQNVTKAVTCDEQAKRQETLNAMGQNLAMRYSELNLLWGENLLCKTQKNGAYRVSICPVIRDYNFRRINSTGGNYGAIIDIFVHRAGVSSWAPPPGTPRARRCHVSGRSFLWRGNVPSVGGFTYPPPTPVSGRKYPSFSGLEEEFCSNYLLCMELSADV